MILEEPSDRQIINLWWKTRRWGDGQAKYIVLHNESFNLSDLI